MTPTKHRMQPQVGLAALMERVQQDEGLFRQALAELRFLNEAGHWPTKSTEEVIAEIEERLKEATK